MTKKEMMHAMVDGKTLINREYVKAKSKAKLVGYRFMLLDIAGECLSPMGEAFDWPGWEIYEPKRIAKKASEIFKILEDEGAVFDSDGAIGENLGFYYKMLRECGTDITKSEWTWRNDWIREE